MKAAWRASSSERHAPPVEMRFVDMFMAALGALIFMAMLMAFLLRFYPRQDAPSSITNNGNNFNLQPFKLTTKTLPAARIGEPYEIAFAFQGGLPPAAWEVAAGQGDIPAGLKFDANAGTLSGVPQKSGTARFVVKAKDQFGTTDSRPYELAVVQPITSSRKIENGLAIVMFIVALLLWLIAVASTFAIRRKLQDLVERSARGETETTYDDGGGIIENVQHDKGIPTYESRLQVSRKTCLFFFFVLLALAAWLVWRIWFS